MGTISVIASGRDGVGKTTTAVFIGAALAKKKKKVLVIELDSGSRSIDIVSSAHAQLVYDISDVLSGKCSVEKAIVSSPIHQNLFIMSAPYNSGTISADRFIKLCTVLSGNYDYVLVDSAASMGALVTAASTAMRAIVVTTADYVSVRSARQVADRLYDMSVPDVRLIINRLVPERVYGGAVPNLDYCIDTVGAKLIGVIPESNRIALAASGVAKLGTCTEQKIFDSIAERIEGEDVPLIIR